MRSSNINIWLSNTRWVACLQSTSLARPPHWPEDKVKVNKFIWTYSSATENVFYQSCFRTANIRGIFCLSYHFLPTFLKQWFSLLIYIGMLTLRIGELIRQHPFSSFSSPICLPLYWYHSAGGNNELVSSPGEGAKTLQWRLSKIYLAFSNDREKTIPFWQRDLNKSE